MNPSKGKPVKDHIFGDLDQPQNSVRWMMIVIVASITTTR
jgi:hypothetical protein